MKFETVFASTASAALFAIGLAASPAHALEVGDSAPCVVLQDLQPDGSSIDQCIRTRDQGKPYVLLEFFATTCGACEDNLPVLAQLAKDVQATTSVRMIGMDRDRAAIISYAGQHRDLIQFPVAIDSDRDASKAYGVNATPTVFILDAKNKVVDKTVGTFEEADLARIKALVAPH